MTNARKVGDQLEKVTERVIANLTAAAWQSLVVSTPVDTGFARSRWTPTIGSPITQVAVRPADDAAARSDASSELSKNQQRAAAIQQGYRLSKGPVFISNPTPYLVFLNQGSSAQAPANFIERAIVQAIQSLASRNVA